MKIVFAIPVALLLAVGVYPSGLTDSIPIYPNSEYDKQLTEDLYGNPQVGRVGNEEDSAVVIYEVYLTSDSYRDVNRFYGKNTERIYDRKNEWHREKTKLSDEVTLRERMYAFIAEDDKIDVTIIVQDPYVENVIAGTGVKDVRVITINKRMPKSVCNCGGGQ